MTASVPFVPQQFIPGFRPLNGTAVNLAFASPQWSTQTGIVAKASGTQANSTQIITTIASVDTVATAADGVLLPLSQPGMIIRLANTAANSMQVFGTSPDTINAVATATGIPQAGGSVVDYTCTVAGKWIAMSAENANFGAITATTIGATGLITAATITASGLITATGGLVKAPTAGGATLAVTAAMSGGIIKLDTAAGTVATLPAATGSGNTYKFIVTTTTTSGAHKILANSVSDFINGIAMGYTGSTAKVFGSAAATNHSIQMPFAGSQPSGGFIGDYFNCVDVAANLWNIDSMYQAGTTPTTPFSTATT